MYLADSMRLIASGLPQSPPFSDSANMIYMQARSRDILERFDLVAFSRSALTVAADLRIDTPARLENIADAVLRRPRRVFLEAAYDARQESFAAMRGFPHVRMPPGRHKPARVGLAVDCFGDGKARIDVSWTFPKATVRREMAHLAPSLPNRLARDAAMEAARAGFGLLHLAVDLGASAPISRTDFDRRYAAGDRSLGVYHDAVEEIGLPGHTAPGAARKRAEAYRMYRLNTLMHPACDPAARPAALEMAAAAGKSPEAALTDAERDLDGEIMYILALLAALEIGPETLHREVRAAAAPRRRRQTSRRALPTDRLSVVSLDIGDGALMRRIAGDPAPGDAPGGAGRIRHPVRGHLFRARNGAIVYRRPHWRGAGQGPLVTRVAASRASPPPR